MYCTYPLRKCLKIKKSACVISIMNMQLGSQVQLVKHRSCRARETSCRREYRWETSRFQEDTTQDRFLYNFKTCLFYNLFLRYKKTRRTIGQLHVPGRKELTRTILHRYIFCVNKGGPEIISIRELCSPDGSLKLLPLNKSRNSLNIEDLPAQLKKAKICYRWKHIRPWKPLSRKINRVPPYHLCITGQWSTSLVNTS